MSLRDTIKGAREEVDANGVLSRKDKEETPQEEASEGEGEKNQGFAKKSLSRAKPAREAAAGVRVVESSGKSKGKGKAAQTMTKEEKKAEKRRQQEINDMRYAASDAILNQNPNYAKYHRTWWILLGSGFIALLFTFVTNIANPTEASDVRTNLGLLSLILVVFSYIAIIAAFIYDWRKIRPLRKQADAAAGAMSMKKLTTTVDGIREQRRAEEAARQAQKAAKKAARGKKADSKKADEGEK